MEGNIKFDLEYKLIQLPAVTAQPAALREQVAQLAFYLRSMLWSFQLNLVVQDDLHPAVG